MRVLTWNLYHGRSRPPSKRPLLREFTAALAGWEWDVALLQEVPPWWPPQLGGVHYMQLTSRNWIPPLQRAISSRNPDILKSWGGGANAILVRGLEVVEHRAVRLRRQPEARWAHGVRLADGGWVVNVHAQNRPQAFAQADCERGLAAGWGSPLVFGGDLNLKRPAFGGLRHVAGNHVDHVLTDGRGGRGEVLDRGVLSDHPPVLATLARFYSAPAEASAGVGQEICWINEDEIDHNAVAESGADFESELFGKGETFTATVDSPGTVEYVCTIHPGMDGTITVERR
jgi:endonuclease/exonuclease/phosphatase family metal-dependent hydrolase